MNTKLQPIEKSKLQELISQNLSSYDIAAKINRSQTTVRWWLKKYNLKTNCSACDKKYIIEYNSKKYGDQKTIKEVRKQFSISYYQIKNAINLNLFISRSSKDTLKLTGRTFKRHTQESKNIISEKRKEYLNRTGKAAWKTHDKFKSKPCEWLKSELIKRNIEFFPEYEPIKHLNRFFAVDVAFIDQKFIIEINGRQHYDANGNLTPYYQDRHDLISSDGWEIWEIPYHETRSPYFLERVLTKLLEKMVLPAEFESATILTSRDAVSGAVYKTDALPIELREDKRTKI